MTIYAATIKRTCNVILYRITCLINKVVVCVSACLSPYVRFAELCLVLVTLSLSSCVSSSSAKRVSFDAGPVMRRGISPEGELRTTAAGPFFETLSDTNGMNFIAVRPFYSRTFDPAKERSIREVLWPLCMIKEYSNEVQWRCIPAFGHDFAVDDPDSRWRMWLFPILFAGQDVHGEKYFAVFPVGGKLNEFLGRDKIFFALFPLYLYSSINSVETRDILFPFCSWTSGKDISRFRIFPFYMKSVAGDRMESRSVMWPIWTSKHYNYNGREGDGFILFPLCGHMKSTVAESWLFLPPFFRYSIGAQGTSGNFPWPFIQYSSANPERLYFWPLWGYNNSHNEKTSFYLWPIVRKETAVYRDGELNRLRIVPIVNYESRTEAPRTNDLPVAEGRVSERYFQLWPLGSYRRDNDAYRFRMLDLWPLKQTPSIERNWAPLWTLYSHVRVGENSEDELLWGLYHRANEGTDARRWSIFPLFSWETATGGGGSKEWNVLMGLFGYKRDELLKTYRMLYFLKFKSGEEEKKP